MKEKNYTLIVCFSFILLNLLIGCESSRSVRRTTTSTGAPDQVTTTQTTAGDAVTTRTTTTEPTPTRNTTTVEERTTTTESGGIVSGTFNLIGKILAFPFK